jgi:hypothetical protein
MADDKRRTTKDAMGLIVRMDSMGRPSRQIKERPAPPAPIMSKPARPQTDEKKK